MRLTCFTLFVALASCCCSCATIIEGSTEQVRYEGGPGKLAFYNDQGKQLPSRHEYEVYDRRHVNYVELDKKQKQHIVTARMDDMTQTDTLNREVNYAWLLADAALIYPFPVFAGVDILTSSIYTFPGQEVRLVRSDNVSLPDPIELVEEKVDHKVMLNGHLGVLLPAISDQSGIPSFGASGGFALGSGFWATAGYTYGRQLEQFVGSLSKRYETEIHSSEIGINYQPLSFAYLIGGLSYDHMIFQRSFGRAGEERPRFGRNLIAGKFGLGFYFGGIFFEYRRVLGLAPFETPEGPGHSVAYNTLRFGGSLRLGWGDGE